MERIYIGTTLILLVSSVVGWWQVNKEKETIKMLREEINRMQQLNYEKTLQINECAYQNYGLNMERLNLQRKNMDMSVREGLNKREIAKLKREIETLKILDNREYELLENAEGISRVTKGDTVKVEAKFNEEIKHKHVYDTDEKVLYEIIKVEEYSMRGRDTYYIYELKKVS